MGLANQQMDVFGHHHVADQFESGLGADFIKDFDKELSCPNAAQKRLTTITTAGQKMEVSLARVPFELVPHEGEKPHPLLRERKECGTQDLVTILCGK